MRVEKLSIENFRGIGKIELELPDSRPVVFIGTNGSGKSSVLDALHLILDDLDSHLRHLANTPTSLVKEGLRVGTSSATIRADVDIETNKLTWILSSKVTQNNVAGRSQAYSKSGAITIYYPTIRRVHKIPLFTDQFDRDPLWALEGADISFTAIDEIDFHTFFLWLRYREDKENEQRVDDSQYRDLRLQAVRQAIEGVMPQFANLRVRRNPDRLMLLKKQGETDTEFNLMQLSDGEKGVFALIGDIARRLAIANPNMDNPLNGIAEVLIDEIELHLHPAWQRKIVPALVETFPNCQFFLTTHSPQVLSEIEDAHIFLLQSTDPEHGITATKIEHLYGRDSNRILEDVMGVDERPHIVKEQLKELFRIIDAGDLKAARKKRADLEKMLYSQEPDFAMADVLMHRLEMRGK